MIELALKEDMPSGDATTDALAVNAQTGHARLIAKQDLTLSGVTVFSSVVQHLDPQSELRWFFRDGESVFANQTLCLISGDLVSLLKAERVALNFLGRMCGIATLTQKFVKAIDGTSCQILDTRKTTPGLRALEKAAVVHGGGRNHRMNLSDEVMIKDNHIDMMGGIAAAISAVKTRTHLKITVETRTEADVRAAVSGDVDRILLDNMDNALIEKCLPLIPNQIEVEASGNMTVERVRSVAQLGVDFISVGALTHSASTADISMMFDWSATNDQRELTP